MIRQFLKKLFDLTGEFPMRDVSHIDIPDDYDTSQMTPPPIHRSEEVSLHKPSPYGQIWEVDLTGVEANPNPPTPPPEYLSVINAPQEIHIYHHEVRP